ncbi:hypothetical protein ANME2D_03395 [Candidatus Methanoperedens nitroreducens]|uniref:Uncharacterized protein n=1 Tax=Candidatus Methanoperedens nitratireducens TaxID=1392998 RepID=A0A062V524_9EURY|nr:DUF2179 domain-containing protein [Candidatus Methanoperedens nitroreducens]KCZ70480.1 hypothetical protein ANME2D_03395 [Candidatus Methanoperedens nitroreducens]MDJ1420918.1 DUF2179 domain-containing protein [Candidatus Methanoperedens sp.]
MISTDFLNSEIFAWVILPILIFTARILDVTLGTIRIIFISRGEKYLAPLFGFFEIIIWLFALGQIMQNLTNIAYYVAYAGGFAMGNFAGIYIENKMAMGTLVVRIITKKDTSELINSLKSIGYGVTSVDAEGATGQVKIVFTIIKRKEVNNVVGIIKRFNPKAFFSIEEVRSASEGIFPSTRSHYGKDIFSSFRLNRLGK